MVPATPPGWDPLLDPDPLLLLPPSGQEAMEQDTVPPVKVTPMGGSMRLYQILGDPPLGPHLPGPRLLLVLLPWLGAQPGHLWPYLRWYLGHGLDVLVVPTKAWHFLRPQRGQRLARSLLRVLGDGEGEAAGDGGVTGLAGGHSGGGTNGGGDAGSSGAGPAGGTRGGTHADGDGGRGGIGLGGTRDGSTGGIDPAGGGTHNVGDGGSGGTGLAGANGYGGTDITGANGRGGTGLIGASGGGGTGLAGTNGGGGTNLTGANSIDGGTGLTGTNGDGAGTNLTGANSYGGVTDLTGANGGGTGLTGANGGGDGTGGAGTGHAGGGAGLNVVCPGSGGAGARGATPGAAGPSALAGHPLLVHAISAGAYTFAQLLLLLRQHPGQCQRLAPRFRGIVYDSLVTGDFGDMARGLANAVPSSPLRPLIRGSVHFYLWALGCCVGRELALARAAFANPPLRCPLLLFYSLDDDLSQAATLRALLEGWRALGIRAHAVGWQHSRHAAHLRSHPQDYRRALLAFLRMTEGAPRARL